MRRIDFRPSVVECRIYEKGGYTDRSAYQGSFIVHIIGDIAVGALLTGQSEHDKCTWDMETTRELMDYLSGLGVRTYEYEHKGKRKRIDIETATRHRRAHG